MSAKRQTVEALGKPGQDRAAVGAENRQSANGMGRRDGIYANDSVEREVQRIAAMRIHELRTLYRATFKSEPPKAFGPDLLRRSIAYRMQEQAYGGLDKPTTRLLNQLIAQYAKAPGRIVLPRQIKPGAILVRQWKGERHRVIVLEAGFAYEGRTYESLSEIARRITGTRWNGPRFFGLRAGNKGEPDAG